MLSNSSLKRHWGSPTVQLKNPALTMGLITLIGLVLLFGGCAMVGPDYIKPTPPEPDKWLESEDPVIESKETDFSHWWTVFNDPILNTLVETAYQQNLSLQIAGVRVIQARAQLGIAFGFQYPQQQFAAGDASVNQVSKNAPNAAFSDRYYDNYSAGFDAVWELDVWGNSVGRFKPAWPILKPPSLIMTTFW